MGQFNGGSARSTLEACSGQWGPAVEFYQLVCCPVEIHSYVCLKVHMKTTRKTVWDWERLEQGEVGAINQTRVGKPKQVMVMAVYNPCSWEVKAGRSNVQEQLELYINQTLPALPPKRERTRIGGK